MIYIIVQDIFDDVSLMGDAVPLVASTPWDYRLADGWTLTIPMDGTFYDSEIRIMMSIEDMVGRI